MYMWMTTLDLVRGKYIQKKRSSKAKYIEEFLKNPVTLVHSFYEWSKWSTQDAIKYSM